MLDFIFIYYLSGADTDISVVNCVKVIINNNDFPSSCRFPSILGFYVSPHFCGETLFLSCSSVRHTVCQRNSSETTEQNFMKLGR
jgi:hypothetical protein